MQYNKYHSKKVEVDGIKFASQEEARRYQRLKAMEESGEISNLQMQVPFILVPQQKLKTQRFNKGQCVNVERPVKYIADFVYDIEGSTIVEDTKGMRTPEYIIKRKLMKYLKGIEIKEI